MKKFQSANAQMLGKLCVIVLGMFAFGYALVTRYKANGELTGINGMAGGE